MHCMHFVFHDFRIGDRVSTSATSAVPAGPLESGGEPSTSATGGDVSSLFDAPRPSPSGVAPPLGAPPPGAPPAVRPPFGAPPAGNAPATSVEPQGQAHFCQSWF